MKEKTAHRLPKNPHHLPSAFSLIEVSIILLIIAIIISGIIKSNDLHSKARLATAQILTQNSPALDVKNLVTWYETSLNKSFINEELQDDGSSISTWYDISAEKITRNHARQTVTDNQPKYYDEIFAKGIPGIKFDGTNDSMDFVSSDLLNTSYTIFVVEQRSASDADNYFISGTGTAANENLQLGYVSDTSLTHSHIGSSNSISYALPAYSSNVTRMHSFSFNLGGGKKYWLNGGLLADVDAADNTQSNPLESFAGAALGKSYNGYLAEILIFNRVITDKERQLIEEYLSKKYNIALS